jgi:alpha-beta hydrolase superfamily lysophospholipase
MNIRKLLFVSAGVIFCLAVFIYLGAGAYIAFKLTHVKREPVTVNPTSLGLPFLNLSFTSTDNIHLSGWLVKANPIGNTTVIFVHGLENNRAQPHHLELAKHFGSEGISSLLFDLRAQGKSAGSFVSAGFFEQRDVVSAVRQIPSHECRIILGSSAGAAAAILAAKQLTTEANGLIIDSSYANINDLLVGEISKSIAWNPSVARIFIPGAALMTNIMYGMDLSQLNLVNIISKIPYPVLIIHGQADSRIPVSQAYQLYRAAPASSKLLIVPKADHTFAYITDTKAYLSAVDQYIKDSCKKIH